MVSPNGFPRPRPEVTRMSVRQLKAELSARDVEISHCRDLDVVSVVKVSFPSWAHTPPNANPPQEMRPSDQSLLTHWYPLVR